MERREFISSFIFACTALRDRLNNDVLDIAEDSRLSSVVSIPAQSIWLGDLCRLLSEKTGVRIECDSSFNGDGETIFVGIVEQSLFSVMSSLWSLNSFGDGMWKWQRSEKPPYSYTFYRTESASQLDKRLKSEIDADFEKHIESIFNLLDMSDEEFSKEVAGGNVFAQEIKVEPYIRGALNTIKNQLSQKNIGNYIKNGTASWTKINSLSVDDQRAMGSFWQRLNPRDGKTGDPLPMETDILVRLGKNSINPTVSLFIGSAEHGGSGYPMIGGEEYARKTAASFLLKWLFEGDNRNQLKILVPPETKKVSKYPLESALNRAIQQNKMSIIAHISKEQNGYKRLNLGESDLISNFRRIGKVDPLWKMRDGILLLSYPGWFLGESNSYRVPLQLMHQLEAKIDKDKFDWLSIEDLIQVSLKFSLEATKEYEKPFEQFKFVLLWRSLFRWIGGNERRLADFLDNLPVQIPLSVLSELQETNPVLIPFLSNQTFYARWKAGKQKYKGKTYPIQVMEILDARRRSLYSEPLTVVPEEETFDPRVRIEIGR